MEKTRKVQKNNVVWEVKVLSEELVPYQEKALSALAKNLEIPGFRKGKIPPEKVKEYVSEEKIMAEAIFLATRQIAADILSNQETEEWLGQPQIQITGFDNDKNLSFTIEYVLTPRVELGEWKKHVKVQKINPEVTQEEIEKALARLQKSRSMYRAVRRPAQRGDFVEISFSGRSGGVQVEGLISERHPFVLGEGRFIEGFEENIQGMSVGENKQFNLIVSPKWSNKTVAGKEIEFLVELFALQERLLPELNDEFARSLGAFADITALKASVGKGLLAEKEEQEKRNLRLKALEQVMEEVSLDIPQILRDQEAERMIEEMRASIERGGLSFEEYLSGVGKTAEQVKADFSKSADLRVKAALVLRALAQELAIEPSQEEIDACVQKQLHQVQSVEEAEKVDPEERRAYCRSILRNEKVLEALEKIAIQN